MCNTQAGYAGKASPPRRALRRLRSAPNPSTHLSERVLPKPLHEAEGHVPCMALMALPHKDPLDRFIFVVILSPARGARSASFITEREKFYLQRLESDVSPSRTLRSIPVTSWGTARKHTHIGQDAAHRPAGVLRAIATPPPADHGRP